MNPDQTLLVTCPECGEELALSSSDWAEFQLGDVLVCDACDAELEVVSLDPPDFAPLGDHTVCPKCSTQFELSDTDLERGRATCPNCAYSFALEFD